MNFIVAVDREWGIGKDGGMLFHIPEDLRYFKNTTMGKAVVMGSATLRSLPGGKPLPGRTNIVLSRRMDEAPEGVVLCRSLGDLFAEVRKYDRDDVFVMGGAVVYNLLMEYCETAYVTKIDAVKPADSFIHNVEQMDGWALVSASERHHHGDIEYTFNIYRNKNVTPMPG